MKLQPVPNNSPSGSRTCNKNRVSKSSVRWKLSVLFLIIWEDRAKESTLFSVFSRLSVLDWLKIKPWSTTSKSGTQINQLLKSTIIPQLVKTSLKKLSQEYTCICFSFSALAAFSCSFVKASTAWANSFSNCNNIWKIIQEWRHDLDHESAQFPKWVILGDPGADSGGKAIFFRPFSLSFATTICPWVSEDESECARLIISLHLY